MNRSIKFNNEKETNIIEIIIFIIVLSLAIFIFVSVVITNNAAQNELYDGSKELGFYNIDYVALIIVLIYILGLTFPTFKNRVWIKEIFYGALPYWALFLFLIGIPELLQGISLAFMYFAYKVGGAGSLFYQIAGLMYLIPGVLEIPENLISNFTNSILENMFGEKIINSYLVHGITIFIGFLGMIFTGVSLAKKRN